MRPTCKAGLRGYMTAGRYIEEIVASPDNNILAFTVNLDTTQTISASMSWEMAAN